MDVTKTSYAIRDQEIGLNIFRDKDCAVCKAFDVECCDTPCELRLFGSLDIP